MTVKLRNHLWEAFMTRLAESDLYRQLGVNTRALAMEAIRFWTAHGEMSPQKKEVDGVEYHRYLFTWEYPGMMGKTITLEYEMRADKLD